MIKTFPFLKTVLAWITEQMISKLPAVPQIVRVARKMMSTMTDGSGGEFPKPKSVGYCKLANWLVVLFIVFSWINYCFTSSSFISGIKEKQRRNGNSFLRFSSVSLYSLFCSHALVVPLALNIFWPFYETNFLNENINLRWPWYDCWAEHLI